MSEREHDSLGQYVGELIPIEIRNTSVLVFQLPRQTNMLSDVYVRGAMNAVKNVLPDGTKALVIGSDVNIYELAGDAAVVLKLKGISIG